MPNARAATRAHDVYVSPPAEVGPPSRPCTRPTTSGLFPTYTRINTYTVHPTCRYVSVRCQTQNETVRHMFVYVLVLPANAAAAQRRAGGFFFLYQKHTFVCLSTDGLMVPTQACEQGWSTAESRSESTFQSYRVFSKIPVVA